MSMIIIDLFAGMGGWTQSFMNDPRFFVYRYDNDPWLRDVEHMTLIDLSKEKVQNIDLNTHQTMPVKLLIGSPPCYEFSNAYSAPKIIAKREGREFTPNMELVQAFIEHVQRIQPEYWLMENVIGNFPLLDISNADKKSIATHKKKAGDKHRHSDHRASFRAFIPEPMSRAIKRNIEAPNLMEWIQ
jgi:hypothetical protein